MVNNHFTSTMAPKYKRPTGFKKAWKVEYGIQTSSVDPQTKQTTSAVCLFCKCFSRNLTTSSTSSSPSSTAAGTVAGNDDRQQRKRTQRVN